MAVMWKVYLRLHMDDSWVADNSFRVHLSPDPRPTNHPDCFPDASGPLGISPASNERPAQMKLYPYARANEHNLSGSPVAPFKMR